MAQLTLPSFTIPGALPPAQLQAQPEQPPNYIASKYALGKYRGIEISSVKHFFALSTNKTFSIEDFKVFSQAWIGGDQLRYVDLLKGFKFSTDVDGKIVWDLALAMQQARNLIYPGSGESIKVIGDLNDEVWKLSDPLIDIERPAPPKPTTKVPRPPNAFILYRQYHHSFVKAQFPDMHNNNISKVIAKQWGDLNEAGKDVWRRKALERRTAHNQAHPGYSYNPRKSDQIKKRKTKRSEPPIVYNTPAEPQVTDNLTAPHAISPAHLHIPLFDSIRVDSLTLPPLTAADLPDIENPTLFVEGVDVPHPNNFTWDIGFDDLIDFNAADAEPEMSRLHQLNEQALTKFLNI